MTNTSEHHKFTSLFTAFSLSAFVGLSEAYLRKIVHHAIPGSADPWMLHSAFLLYGIVGLIVGAICLYGIRTFRTSARIFFLILTFWAAVWAIYLWNQWLASSIVSAGGLAGTLIIILITFAILSFVVSRINVSGKIFWNTAFVVFLISILILILQSPFSFGSKSTAANSNSTPNVILITLDTTRADHLSAYGYKRDTTPFLSKLATEGVLFEDAFTVSSWTLPSHSSIFTGKLPSAHGATYQHLWLDTSEDCLAEILKRKGYQTAAFVSGPFLLATFNVTQGFDYYDDQLDPLSGIQQLMLVKVIRRFYKAPLWWVDGQRNAAEVNRQIMKWFDQYSGRKPFFLFINYFDPHDPYIPPAPYDKKYSTSESRMNGRIEGIYSNRDTGERISKEGNPLRENDYQALKGLYDGEIRFMDDQLSKLFEFLENRNLLSNTLILITADHGESIGEHKILDHGHALYEEQIKIPLLLIGPRVPKGEKISGIVRNIDLLPTLLEYLKLPAPSEIQGKSFLPRLTGAADDGRIYVGEIFRDPNTRVKRFQRDLKSRRDPGSKLLWASNGHHEFYDLLSDPGEDQNLVNDRKNDFDKLTQQLFDYLKTVPQKEVRGRPHIDEESRESLKATGYIQ